MAVEQLANLAQTVLSASIDDTTPTIPVVNGGAPFPAQAQFRIIIDGEIMLVTAGASTSSWTVTRGAEGTPRTSHGAGASVTHALTAGALASAFAGLDTNGKVPSSQLPQIGTPVTAIASPGATQALAAGQFSDVTLDKDVAPTLTGAVAGTLAEVSARFTQNNVGGHALTFPGSVSWVAGSSPAMPQGAGAALEVYLWSIDGGTTWRGQYTAAVAYTGGPLPAINGFIGWTTPPEDTNGQFANTSGTLLVSKLLLPAGPINRLHAFSQAAGSGLTLGKMALFDLAGNPLVVSSNQAAAVQSVTGNDQLITVTLTSTFNWQGGPLFCGLLAVGTTSPKLWFTGGNGTTFGSSNIVAPGGTPRRFAIASQSDISSSTPIAVPSLAASGQDAVYWMAAS